MPTDLDRTLEWLEEVTEAPVRIDGQPLRSLMQVEYDALIDVTRAAREVVAALNDPSPASNSVAVLSDTVLKIKHLETALDALAALGPAIT